MFFLVYHLGMAEEHEPRYVSTNLDEDDSRKLDEICELERLRIADVLRRALRHYHKHLTRQADVA